MTLYSPAPRKYCHNLNVPFDFIINPVSIFMHNVTSDGMHIFSRTCQLEEIYL